MFTATKLIARPTYFLAKSGCPTRVTGALARSLGTLKGVKESELDVTSFVHFRSSSRPHPLGVKPVQEGDHLGLQQNHIWTREELAEKLTDLRHFKPVTITDRVVNKVMFGLYHTFNFFTGYHPVNPTVDAIKWRLIMLESIAGVPGFVAAGVRHFSSLRTLRKDYGWISTLLEEAENERMHLLICLNTFEANALTRLLVIAAQYAMVPLLLTTYLVHPRAMHRFVGYLEETACSTYVNTIRHIETPGTKLHDAWAKTPAPPLAKGYYLLPDDAMWVDTLKCMMADEANHRDVNHTFASMNKHDPNPFLDEHRANAIRSWQLHQDGQTAWSNADVKLPAPKQ